jgi:hypothetical protein
MTSNKITTKEYFYYIFYGTGFLSLILYWAEERVWEPKGRLAADNSSRLHRGAMEGICPSKIAQPSAGGSDGLTDRTMVTKVKGPDLRFDYERRHPLFRSNSKFVFVCINGNIRDGQKGGIIMTNYIMTNPG